MTEPKRARRKKRRLDAVPLGEIDASDIATVFGAVARVKNSDLEVKTSAAYFNSDNNPTFAVSLESFGDELEFRGKTAQAAFHAAALFIRDAGDALAERLEEFGCDVIRAEEFIEEASNG